MAGKIVRGTRGKPLIDLVGKSFGRYLVLSEAPKRGFVRYWHCRCECGTERQVAQGNLIAGYTKSCGCFSKELHFARYRHFSKHADYGIWLHMKNRCYLITEPAYPRYGGRGITICDRWRFGQGDLSGFECFIADMGDRPSSKHSIDRVNNDGNYELSNCQWATDIEQANNTRRNHYIEFQGEKITLSQASRRMGLNPKVVSDRVNRYGWSLDKALNTPTRSP